MPCSLPKRVELCRYVGTDKDLVTRWAVKSVDDTTGVITENPVDLTGGFGYLVISDSANNKLLEIVAEIQNPTEGEIRFAITAAHTVALFGDAFSKRALWYDVEFVNSTSKSTTLIAGDFILTADKSKRQ